MKLAWKLAVLTPTLTSLLLMPFWLVLTEPYVVKPSPLKLYEVIHFTYYIGFIAIILSMAVLSMKSRKDSSFILNPYLATAILVTFYLQLPPIALFEHPVSDHTIHLLPAFYMLREGNINMPDYPHPETVAPQLFASILLTVTLLQNPLENLHRISLFILPLLTTLYVYIFMRRLGVSERFAMMASVLNMGLMHVSFMFLRQIYAMPLYVMLVFLVFMMLKEMFVGYSILAIIIATALIMSDPAHILLTIIPLIFFAIMWKGLSLLRKVNHRHFKNPWTFTLFMGVAFIFWIINRYTLLLLDLWRIAETMWDVFIRSINELALPTRESPAYWGRPTALVYNDYYMLLYRVRVTLIALSIILPATLLIYILLNKKSRSMIFRCETLYLKSFFVVAAITLITRGYGFAYTPYAVIILFTLLGFVSESKRSKLRLWKVFIIFAILLMLSAALASPHITHSGGRVRLPAVDINAVLWLGEYSQQTFFMTPGFGRWLSETAYILEGYHIKVGDYLFYEGLTVESINRLAQYNAVFVPRSVLMHFEKTDACYSVPEMFRLLFSKLSDSHSLIYNSGNPFVTIWIKN